MCGLPSTFADRLKKGRTLRLVMLSVIATVWHEYFYSSESQGDNVLLFSVAKACATMNSMPLTLFMHHIYYLAEPHACPLAAFVAPMPRSRCLRT